MLNSVVAILFTRYLRPILTGILVLAIFSLYITGNQDVFKKVFVWGSDIVRVQLETRLQKKVDRWEERTQNRLEKLNDKNIENSYISPTD